MTTILLNLVSGKPVSLTPYCYDPRAPCTCGVHMVHLDKAGLVPVTEYVCDHSNTKKHVVPGGFVCEQLTSKVWVQSLDIVVDVKSGCELRCTGGSCG